MASEDIKVLKAKRSRIKASITQMVKFVNNYDVSTEKITDIQVRNNKLEQLYNEFVEVQANIDSLHSDENDNSFVEFEENYYFLKSNFESLISSTTMKPSQSEIHSGRPSKFHDTINLPKINLPCFEGKIENWKSFFDLFESTIHNNSDLADIQKYYYLKSSLKGEPLDIISSLPLTQANYSVALEILKDRYSNKKLIVNKHVKALFSLTNALISSPQSLKQLLDTTNVNIRALNCLGYKTEEWDVLLVYMVSSKLDHNLRTKWELSNTTSEPPSYAELESFLKQYTQALEACIDHKPKFQSVNNQYLQSVNNHQKYASVKANTTEIGVKHSCPICSQPHKIFHCIEFLNLKPNDRVEKVKSLHRCFNCLSSGHSSKTCSSSKCKSCGKSHNTLLHIQKNSKDSFSQQNTSDQKQRNCKASEPVQTPYNEEVISSKSCDNVSSKILSTGVHCKSRVLLATAMVEIEDSYGEFRTCRTLIDPGSEGSFISESCMQKLGLKRHSCNIQVQGVGNTHVGMTRGCTLCKILTKDSEIISVKAFIMTKLTSVQSLNISTHNWTHISNLQLADPLYYQSGQVELILGADVYISLLRDGLVKGPPGSPSAINTKLGFLLMGEISSIPCSSSVHSFFIAQESIQNLMENFWKVEEVINEATMVNDEDIECENHFIKTHCRNQSGRFCVNLPFKPSINQLGDSYSTALQRFHRLESSLTFEKREKYNEFMREYIDLNHMQLTPEENLNLVGSSPVQYYYLPHHAVYRPSSSTTKVRVVFDASCKTRHGTSLNDHLLIGPKLQVDIVSLLTRFRLHKVAFTADIEKFYRQINVCKQDQAYQRILWRFSPAEAIKSYDLCTVTYGTSCAPYLSIRCLHQLAEEVKTDLTKVSKVLKEDFYVDDLISGANSIREAKELKQKLETVLHQAGFSLRKWSSNVKELVDVSSTQTSQYQIQNKDSTLKVLGLAWDPDQDVYKYSVDLPNLPDIVTKRTILSEIAKLYDPLGLICPIITKAKIIMQSTWVRCLKWDEEVPLDIIKDFNRYRNGLLHLQLLQIPRPLTLFCSHVNYQLIGFCDASENAFAGVLYLRSCAYSQISVNIIYSKSKVSPMKKLTIPRLELCGAVLLTKMVKKIKSLLPEKCQIYLFSDSTIVLSWISKPASTWKTFVSSRVSQIHSFTEKSQWYHVSSEQNPADIASRGCQVEKLIKDDKWWLGPSWLSDPNFNEKLSNCEFYNQIDIPETRSVKCTLNTTQGISDWYSKYSSYSTAIRVTAYCLRYIKILKRIKLSGPLTSQELDYGLMCIVKHIQQLHFKEDINYLNNHEHVKHNSKLLSLNPFIDDTGVLRVGGRIQNSQLSYNKVHQIILPVKHSFVQSMIVHLHEKYFHAGIQFIMNNLRQKFWLVGNVRSSVRNVVRKCKKCIRFQAETTNPMMGSLPPARVTLTRPFLHTGCDYAGPFLIKQLGGRCKTLRKVYLAVFICMSVKAVHLELVTDLTTEAYLAALNRFVSRRGVPLHIYSDNGTTFVGADNSLTKFFRDNKNTIKDCAARKSINWHFIPPGTPHMGGIWESAVKSAKHHLKRVIGDHILNFEELNTLIIQIEAILNSRPLCKVTNDQSDVQMLTPGHFIVGDSLVALPDSETHSEHINYNKRWQLIQKLRKDFWNRWCVEYLHTLQQRSKWKVQVDNVKVGDVVLLKEDNLPPMNYSMGVIQKVFPGRDMVIRTVEVKTSKGVFTRPVVRLIMLPTEPDCC